MFIRGQAFCSDSPLQAIFPPMHIPSPIAWTETHAVRILDQTLLPGAETYRDLDSVEAVAEAIRANAARHQD